MSLTVSDSEHISYRRLLSCFAKALDPENLQKIAFIYCGDSNIDCSEKGVAFNLLLKLERLDYFSFENPSPLVQVAEDACRSDWAKKFKEYVETRATALPNKSSAKKRSQPIPSEERQHLEDVHDAIVTRVMVIEDRFQEMWKREVITKEEEMKFFKRSEKIVQEVDSELKRGMKRLQSRPNSGYSSSGSSSGSELGSSPTHTMLEHRAERDRDKPMPKPRKPKPPPPYRPSAQESPYKAAVQESTRHNSPLLCAPTLSVNKDSHTHDQLEPPPIPPKRQNSPNLTSKHQHQSGTSQMCYTKQAVCMSLQRKLSDGEKEVMTEENDQTGDSGMETGSGNGALEEWRQAIRNPPAVTEKEHLYTKVRQEMTDEENDYQALTPSTLTCPSEKK